jgi:hypothetical protein
MILRGPLTPRRKVLLGVLVALLLGVGWLYWDGAAITAGLSAKDMDWNGDGTVSQQEMLEAVYAVRVTREQDGNRTCTHFLRRGSEKAFRVDCRTEFGKAGK